MYAPHDDRSCILGIPQGGWKQSINGLESWEGSKVSKIGGYPIWHDRETAPTIEQILCGICKSTTHMVLVAQIYAPIDSYERSLYVFCCNTRECSLKAQGWIAFRNQRRVEVASTTKVVINDTQQNNGNVCNNKQSVWDFLSDGFGNLNETGEDDLLSLLETRDFSLSSSAATTTTTKPQTASKSPKKSSLAKTANSSDFLPISNPLPLCKIKEQEEYWDYALDDEDEDILDGGMDSDHIDSLIANYLKDEDDEDNLKSLQALGLGNNNSRLAKDIPLHIGNEDDDDDEDDEGLGRKGNSNDTKMRVEMYFQKRISIDPKQVLRYAYDGTPLWITSPDPSEDFRKSGGLLCTICGEQRVFECQLMPALLSHLSKNMPGTTGRKTSSTSSDNAVNMQRVLDADILGDGMDFGVVTVWSCPNSCDGRSVDDLKESIIIQPPPDFV